MSHTFNTPPACSIGNFQPVAIRPALTDEVEELPRPEYPRPDFCRGEGSWLNLNGAWEFTFDDAQRGRSEGWEHLRRLEGSITTPLCLSEPA